MPDDKKGTEVGGRIDSKQLAWKIRRHALDMVQHAHASHIGSILSIADVVAVLYSDILQVDPKKPDWPQRDRFVLSKGHSGVAVYAALAECGFYPVSSLLSYGDDGGMFSCHISHVHVPGVEVSTGSLGHGCCMACGMALHAKLRAEKWKVYTIVGDGECNEGTVWEMAALANHYRLDNLTVVIDCNGMQAMGLCKDVLDMEPMAEKWRSFGWHVADVRNGHDHRCLREAFLEPGQGKPKAVIAHTIKGKGVSFMENELLWHYRDPQGELYERASAELEELQL